MISVIIPARNEEKNLHELLESLKAQTYKRRFEILVIDGKSSDKTREVAKKYGCRVIIQKKLGVSNAKNLGGKKAKGNILVFLDADHIVNRTFLMEIEKCFKDKKVKCARPKIIPLQNNWIQKALAIQIELATKRQRAWEYPTIFRKEVFMKVGGYDENLDFGEDRELPHRVKKLGYKTVLIKKAINYVKPVDSLIKLFKQGRWYGRTIFPYFRKTKDIVPLIGMLIYSSFAPLLILGFFLKPFFYFFLLILIFLFFYSLVGFLTTKNPYAFLMIPVNIVRGFGELVGMIEGIFIKRYGKL